MASAIGRNAPCPCGSGKKYKQCCLRSGSNADHNFAQTASEKMRQAMAGQDFESLEEVQAFLDKQVQLQNAQPLAEFQGLSPAQMQQMLDFPFDSPQLVVSLEPLRVEPAAAIMSLFELIVDAIGDKGLKPTAKGNLPRAFCREAVTAYQGAMSTHEKRFYQNIASEEDFLPLHVTRVVAELAGLIRKYKGRFILSRDCRQRLESGGTAAIYPRLLRAYTQKFNWGYWDGYPELPFIQRAFLFTLFLLARFGSQWRPDTFYEDAFLLAFPSLIDEAPQDGYFDPEDIVCQTYTWRTLVHFVDFFGLASVKPDSDKPLERSNKVIALPLLQEVVQFQVGLRAP